MDHCCTSSTSFAKISVSFRFKNPFLEYVLRDNGIVMDPYYPCIKYKKAADPRLDGTDYFIVAESMHLKPVLFDDNDLINCSLSFACERDQKAFYKLIKDCLQF